MKRTVAIFSVITALIYGVLGCKDTSVSAPGDQTVIYNHPLAQAGLSAIFIDGVQFPFNDNFDYAEYYQGQAMKDEYSYYLDRGFHSVLNFDLNADSVYLSLMLLDVDVKTGVYPISDSAFAGVAQISYRFNDSLTNILVQKTLSGSLQITKVDTLAKRISGIFTCMIYTPLTKTQHLMEGSFTDLYFRLGEAGGQVMTADIAGTNWTSGFSSAKLFDGFGNINGQGRSSEHFAIVMRTDESKTDGYESFSMLIRKPIHPGTFDIEPGFAIYSKYGFDSSSGKNELAFADTNRTLVPSAVVISDFDTIRRRISGTFMFNIEDGSSRSPVTVRNGKFTDLFY
ncbi:MAG TPA: hypothetical protein VEW28_08410 [Candidatus Kapabacteria bacterium]|nr:hypothetical protein [Candidatus Kapabacteria bacterium]